MQVFFQAVKIPLVEEHWVVVEGGVERPSTRDDILIVLADVKSILVKATKLEQDSLPTIT